jgi:hypothetical protein
MHSLLDDLQVSAVLQGGGVVWWFLITAIVWLESVMQHGLYQPRLLPAWCSHNFWGALLVGGVVCIACLSVRLVDVQQISWARLPPACIGGLISSELS